MGTRYSQKKKTHLMVTSSLGAVLPRLRRMYRLDLFTPCQTCGCVPVRDNSILMRDASRDKGSGRKNKRRPKKQQIRDVNRIGPDSGTTNLSSTWVCIAALLPDVPTRSLHSPPDRQSCAPVSGCDDSPAPTD